MTEKDVKTLEKEQIRRPDPLAEKEAESDLDETRDGDVDWNGYPDAVEDTPPSKQFPIFVSYQVGKKLDSRIVRAPFDDIETEAQISSVVDFLSRDAGGKKITIINWKALEG